VVFLQNSSAFDAPSYQPEPSRKLAQALRPTRNSCLRRFPGANAQVLSSWLHSAPTVPLHSCDQRFGCAPRVKLRASSVAAAKGAGRRLAMTEASPHHAPQTGDISELPRHDRAHMSCRPWLPRVLSSSFQMSRNFSASAIE
jgi:hypothetical protein